MENRWAGVSVRVRGGSDSGGVEERRGEERRGEGVRDGVSIEGRV